MVGEQQPRLPGTLPTTAQARSALRGARVEVREKRRLWESLKTRAAAARDEMAAALVEVEEAEEDLVEAKEDGGAEAVTAEKRREQASRRYRRAATDADKVRAALKLAKTDLAGAEGRLAAARGDLDAIAEGRRS